MRDGTWLIPGLPGTGARNMECERRGGAWYHQGRVHDMMTDTLAMSLGAKWLRP